MFKCPWCNYYEEKFDNALRVHVQKKHQKTAKELYDSFNSPHLCSCGCGQETKFHGVVKGYSNFILGHAARVSNNFHVNGEETYRKQSETKKKKFASGELVMWNKGLSKETDLRVAYYGVNGSTTILSNPDELAKRSEKMSSHRLDGTIPTQTGQNHSQWTGGYSTLAATAHSLLYKSWKFPKFKAANFKCTRCESTKGLCVHHDGERFATILHEVSDAFGFEGQDDYELKSKIAQRIEEIHLERNVSGVVLCEKCHAAEHEKLGERFNIL